MYNTGARNQAVNMLKYYVKALFGEEEDIL